MSIKLASFETEATPEEIVGAPEVFRESARGAVFVLTQRGVFNYPAESFPGIPVLMDLGFMPDKALEKVAARHRATEKVLEKLTEFGGWIVPMSQIRTVAFRLRERIKDGKRGEGRLVIGSEIMGQARAYAVELHEDASVVAGHVASHRFEGLLAAAVAASGGGVVSGDEAIRLVEHADASSALRQVVGPILEDFSSSKPVVAAYPSLFGR